MKYQKILILLITVQITKTSFFSLKWSNPENPLTTKIILKKLSENPNSENSSDFEIENWERNCGEISNDEETTKNFIKLTLLFDNKIYFKLLENENFEKMEHIFESEIEDEKIGCLLEKNFNEDKSELEIEILISDITENYFYLDPYFIKKEENEKYDRAILKYFVIENNIRNLENPEILNGYDISQNFEKKEKKNFSEEFLFSNIDDKDKLNDNHYFIFKKFNKNTNPEFQSNYFENFLDEEYTFYGEINFQGLKNFSRFQKYFFEENYLYQKSPMEKNTFSLLLAPNSSKNKKSYENFVNFFLEKTKNNFELRIFNDSSLHRYNRCEIPERNLKNFEQIFSEIENIDFTYKIEHERYNTEKFNNRIFREENFQISKKDFENFSEKNIFYLPFNGLKDLRCKFDFEKIDNILKLNLFVLGRDFFHTSFGSLNLKENSKPELIFTDEYFNFDYNCFFINKNFKEEIIFDKEKKFFLNNKEIENEEKLKKEYESNFFIYKFADCNFSIEKNENFINIYIDIKKYSERQNFPKLNFKKENEILEYSGIFFEEGILDDNFYYKEFSSFLEVNNFEVFYNNQNGFKKKQFINMDFDSSQNKYFLDLFLIKDDYEDFEWKNIRKKIFEIKDENKGSVLISGKKVFLNFYNENFISFKKNGDDNLKIFVKNEEKQNLKLNSEIVNKLFDLENFEKFDNFFEMRDEIIKFDLFLATENKIILSFPNLEEKREEIMINYFSKNNFIPFFAKEENKYNFGLINENNINLENSENLYQIKIKVNNNKNGNQEFKIFLLDLKNFKNEDLSLNYKLKEEESNNKELLVLYFISEKNEEEKFTTKVEISSKKKRELKTEYFEQEILYSNDIPFIQKEKKDFVIQRNIFYFLGGLNLTIIQKDKSLDNKKSLIFCYHLQFGLEILLLDVKNNISKNSKIEIKGNDENKNGNWNVIFNYGYLNKFFNKNSEKFELKKEEFNNNTECVYVLIDLEENKFVSFDESESSCDKEKGVIEIRLSVKDGEDDRRRII